MTDSNIIINGGNPMGDCPIAWKEANKWIEEANEDKCGGETPKWSFDCGFKLDFDGPLLSVTSRFYPPKSHYGEGWDGDVEILLTGKTITSKLFKTKTLEELKTQVEEYVGKIKEKLSGLNFEEL